MLLLGTINQSSSQIQAPKYAIMNITINISSSFSLLGRMIVIVTLLLAGCGGGGGGGGGSGTVTSTLSFPFKSAFVNSILNGTIKDISISGSCSGSGRKIATPATTTSTFEGAQVFASTVTTQWQLTGCNLSSINQTGAAYFDNNFVPLGFNTNGNYAVYQTPPTLPNTVTVGTTGTYGTQQLYTNSTKSVSNGYAVQTYIIEADTSSTAIINLITKVYNVSGSLSVTEQDRYRIAISGPLSRIADDLQYSSGVHLILTYSNPILTDISITPIASSIPKGQPVAFAATGKYSDGSTSNVIDQLTWTSSNSAVASISIGGVASTLSIGSTIITASAKGITSNSANLSVTAASLTSIAITPTISTVVKGLTTNFSASGTYSDGTTTDISNLATWSSGNPSIATINSTTGVATGVNVGSTDIFASFNGITSTSANLTVNNAVLTGLSISSISTSIPKGLPATFTATGSYSDNSTGNVSGSVNWASSDTNVAVMNVSGIASTLAQGTANITASMNGLTSNSLNLTVTAPILTTLTITPSNQSILVGNTQQFSASGALSDGSVATLGSITWSSSNTSVSTINNFGLATTLTSGSTNISVSSSGVTSNNALLTATYAPIGVFAISGLGQATVSWSPEINATSYNIYWGLSPGVTFASNKISGATSPYIHTGLASNSTIYYRVSALKNGTESLSNETFTYVYSGGNPVGSFTPTVTSLVNARYYHTATLLQNGKVLIAGGTNQMVGTLSSAEIYDPATGSFTPTGSMSSPRSDHTATLLPNGKVLVIGGGTFTASAEIYDPTTGNFTTTAGSMSGGRSYHTATLLSNGKVLVVGGSGSAAPFGVYSTAEIFDPTTGGFSLAGSLFNNRMNHTATLMADGRVLVIGGIANSYIGTAEIFDPTTNNFTYTGSMASARYRHTANLLPNGKVIVMGGMTGAGGSQTGNVEIYDPVTGSFSPAGNSTPRYSHSTVLLPNGKVLITGGLFTGNYGGTLMTTSWDSSEIYDPATSTFTTTGIMALGRGYHTATLLHNGNVLVTGGLSSNAQTATAELFQ